MRIVSDLIGVWLSLPVPLMLAALLLLEVSCAAGGVLVRGRTADPGVRAPQLHRPAFAVGTWRTVEHPPGRGGLPCLRDARAEQEKLDDLGRDASSHFTT
jgi:hypothetical protein